MQRQRIDLSIHRDDDLLAFERIMDELLVAGLRVYIDLATVDDALVTHTSCRQVRGSQQDNAKTSEPKAGVRYPVYRTCLMTASGEASALARTARLTSELRVRAYESDPGDEISYGWQPTDFWDATLRRPEDEGAVFVAKTRDDATALDVMISDAFRPLLLREWSSASA